MGGGASRTHPAPTYVTPDDGLGDDVDIEEARCPITMEIMRDPVICADGHSYERGAIEAWLKRHSTSPTTNAKLDHKRLVPNHALRSIILARRAEMQSPGSQVAESRGDSSGRAGDGSGSSSLQAAASAWRIDPSLLHMTDTILGRGAWGVVRLGQLLDEHSSESGTLVAVKMLPEAPSRWAFAASTSVDEAASPSQACSSPALLTPAVLRRISRRSSRRSRLPRFAARTSAAS